MGVMNLIPTRLSSLLAGAVLGVVALTLLTAATECEWSANGPLPWPTPTPPADPQEPWEEFSGWTWEQLEEYVADIAVEMSGGGAGAAGSPGTLPEEGAVLPSGATVVCSNAATGVYIIQLASAPPPPAPFETDSEVTLAKAAGQATVRTDAPGPLPSDADGDLLPLEEEEDEEGAVEITC
jgi:hypothetical protein